MTVMNGKDGYKVYAGDGQTTVFPVPFTFRKNTDIIVSRRGTLATVKLTLGDDYTISGDGLAKAASVTLLATPVVGEKVLIERKVPARQEQSLDGSGQFPSSEVEKVLDDMARAIGDVQRIGDRAIVLDVESEGAVLPQASVRAGKLIGFSSDDGSTELLSKEDFKGDPGYVNASGPLADRDAYDDEAPGFTYLATDQTPHILFFRETEVGGVWSPGTAYGRGELGDVMRRDWGNAVGSLPTNLVDASILSGMMPLGVPIPWPYQGALPDDRFIELYGATIGKEGSGADIEGEALREYFEICKATPSLGNAGDEDFDALDLVKTPDMRGVPFVGVDTMGGLARNVLQRSTTITLTTASTAATVGSTVGLAAGMYVIHDGVPAGTKIADVGTGGEITLSAAATEDAADEAVRFSFFADPENPGQMAGSIVAKILQRHLPPYDLDVTDPKHIHALNDPGHAHGKSGDAHAHADSIAISGQTTKIVRNFDYSTAAVQSGGSGPRVNAISYDTTDFAIVGGIFAAATGISINTNSTGITVVSASTGISVSSAGGGQNFGLQTPGMTARWIVFAKRVSIAPPAAYGIDGRYFTFDGETDQADPGVGRFRLNHADPAQATLAYVDNEDRNGHAIGDFLDTWDAGRLEIIGISAPGTFRLYWINGLAVDGNGYRIISITHLDGSGDFEEGDAFALLQVPGGAEGPQGIQGPQGEQGIQGEQGEVGPEPVLSGTSDTSLTIGAGAKAFSVGNDIAWAIGQRLRAASLADPTNYMEGLVADYAAGALTLTVDTTGGAGTFDDWNIFIVGQPGAGAVDSVNGLTGAVALTPEILAAVRGMSVRVASTANVNLAAPGAAIDDIALAAGEVALLWQQTDPAKNGAWTWNGAAVPMTRVATFAAYDDLPGAVFIVQEGTLYGNVAFQCVSAKGGTLDTDPIDILDFYTAQMPAGEIVENYDAAARPGFIMLDGSTLTDGALDNPRCAARNPWMVSGDDLVLTDRRGKFDRVWANGSAIDPNRATRTARAGDGQTGDYPGTEQAMGAPAITGEIRILSGNFVSSSDTGAINKGTGATAPFVSTAGSGNSVNIEFDAQGSPGTGAAAAYSGSAHEVRPVNHNVSKQMRLG